MTPRPALFLDRDGVINEEVGYLHKWQDCRFIDGIVDLLATANQLGYVTCVITNQAGIARGMYTEDDFHELTRQIAADLLRQGARIDATYYSPFHPTHGIGHFKQESDCRKPAPGMLLRAAREHNLDLAQSVLVGDRCTDLEAGAAAGVPDLYLFGTTESGACNAVRSYTRTDRLSLVRERLLARAAANGKAAPYSEPAS